MGAAVLVHVVSVPVAHGSTRLVNVLPVNAVNAAAHQCIGGESAGVSGASVVVSPAAVLSTAANAGGNGAIPSKATNAIDSGALAHRVDTDVEETKASLDSSVSGAAAPVD